MRREWAIGACLVGVMLTAPLRAQTTGELNRRAAELYRARQFGEAVAELKRSLAIDPRQAAMVKLLGLCYQLSHQTEEAERAFTTATELNAGDAEAWYFLGRAQYQRNFFEKSAGTLEKARRLNPCNARVLEQLGLALEAAGETGRALAAYEEAVKLNPPPSAYLSYGILLYKLNRLEAGERQLQQAKQLNPRDWHAYFELGKVYWKRQQFTDAARELEAAAKFEVTEPDQAVRIAHLLGQVYLRLGREADARRLLAAAAGTNP